MSRFWLTGLVVIGVVAAGCTVATDAPEIGAGADTSTTADPPRQEGSDEPITRPLFCDLLSPEQIGQVIGAEVTTATGPFDACEFSQEDARALSGSLGVTDIVGGGYEAYQYGTSATMDAPSRHEFDLGSGAYVDVGTVAGGENYQVAGGVLVGDVIYTLNLAQGVGMSQEDLLLAGEALLRLMLDAA